MPQWKWASSLLEGRTSWIFSSCDRCSRLTTGTSGTCSGGLWKGHSLCELLGASRDSSPVDAGAYDLGWSGCQNLRIPLQCGHGSWGTSEVSLGESVLGSSWGMYVGFPQELLQQCHASRRVDQGICGFPSRLSHKAFPRGFHTGLSHVPPCCASILGLKVEAVKEKQVSLEWTETSGELW